MERSFAGHQDQASPLLQGHVCGARDQAFGRAVTDRRQGLHAARRHDHPVVAKRTARNRRSQIARRMHHSGQRGDIARTVTGFLTNRDLGPTAQNQVTLNTQLRQGGQKPDPITGAGRPGHGDDDAHALKHYSWRSNSSVTDPPRTTVRTERCRPVAEPAQAARCCCGDIAASKPKQSIGTKVGTAHLTVVQAGYTTNICRPPASIRDQFLRQRDARPPSKCADRRKPARKRMLRNSATGGSVQTS